MTRGRYLILFSTIVLLVIFAFDSKLAVPKTPSVLTVQLIIGAIAWAVIWFRLRFLHFRQELAIFPALPLLLAPVNDLVIVIDNGIDTGIPYLPYILVFAWLGTAVTLAMTFMPDKKEPGQYRMDAVSIMTTVFASYFCLFFVIEWIGQIIYGY